jgi:hypothetical protein
LTYRNRILDEDGVREKFGVPPALIPDYLVLVGDAQDGYPGITGIGAVTAARLLKRHGAIEEFPPEALGGRREEALLYKELATLRTDAMLFRNVDELEWQGPTGAFAGWAKKMGEERMVAGREDPGPPGQQLTPPVFHRHSPSGIARSGAYQVLSAHFTFIPAGCTSCSVAQDPHPITFQSS